MVWLDLRVGILVLKVKTSAIAASMIFPISALSPDSGGSISPRLIWYSSRTLIKGEYSHIIIGASDEPQPSLRASICFSVINNTLQVVGY